jgi:histidinol-phosphate/aromatic aminotransferase/cobyric acid decarboxylase-like protein
LIKVIAETRHIPEKSILPAAGSSDLIFLALRSLLNKNSKVLIIDPSYGEYVHVLEKLIQCKVDRFRLSRNNDFRFDTQELLASIKPDHDLVVIVNPNSPTGVYIPKEDMEKMLAHISHSTLVWIDETYVEYAGSDRSLEAFASRSMNVIVCKSMSKVYALSGARCAYLCCSPHIIETLRSITPPWAVSLPAQAAAITALKDPGYYEQKYEETHRFREVLRQDLHDIGIVDIVDSMANFLLFYLPEGFPSTQQVLEYCKQHDLYLRDVSNMGTALGQNAIRIAVKDEWTNKKMISILKKAFALPKASRSYVK